MKRLFVSMAVMMAALVLLSGVVRAATPTKALHSRRSRRTASPELIAPGEKVYQKQYAACHGLDGRGNGEAAYLLYPKPCDFVAAEYGILPAEASREQPLVLALSSGDDILAKVPPARVFPRPGNAGVAPNVGHLSFYDWISGTWREKPSPAGYPRHALKHPGYYDADFRYADELGPQRWSDRLKRLRPEADWLFATGGEARWRFHNERNRRLEGRNNSYHLYRAAVYTDLWYRDQVRAFIEFRDARVFGEDLPRGPVDADHTDFQNLFIDVKFAEIADYPAYVRVGRQEILLGSQRLLSPLEWGNTGRTFQGVRVFRQGGRFDVDAFWLQLVPAKAGQMNWGDTSRNFAGLWTTYRHKPGHFADLFYLFYNEKTFRRRFDLNTIGGRSFGDHQGWLWDVEGAIQFGRRLGEKVLAGMVTTGGGYHFASWPMNPRLWVFYDFASGSRNPTRGRKHTFDQLFPFGHYYLGWADLVGRRNIHDFNGHFFLYPMPWITFWMQYHHFELANRRDALYNPEGRPLRQDASGRSGRHVGDEVGVVINFHLYQNYDILAGHSVLFPGRFIRRVGSSRTLQHTFVQCQVRW